jgi:hypothetical protein
MQTATNPNTGEKVVLIGSEWKPFTQSATNPQGVKAFLVGNQWLSDEGMPSDRTASTQEETMVAYGPRRTPLKFTGINAVMEQIGAPIQAVSEGVIKGGSNILFGAEQLLGKGAQELGAAYTSRAVIEDALRRQAGAQARVAPFKQEYPISTGIGELGLETLITAPIGGAMARPLAATAQYAPAIAPYVNPLVNALRSSGFRTGLIPAAKAAPGVAPQAIPLATRAADIGARAFGGGATGGATAAFTNPDEIGAGVDIGAGLAVVAPPTLKVAAKSLGFLKDAFTGQLPAIGAGKIARDVAGDRIGAIRAALTAAPEDLMAAQAASGVQKDAWQALGAMTSKTDDASAVMKRQAADDLGVLQRMAEGGNETEARTAYEQSIKRLNQLTADMRAVELQAANQAAQTTNRLAPQMQQRQASMVNALREGMPANLPSGAAGIPAPGVSGIHAGTEALQRANVADAAARRLMVARSQAARGGISESTIPGVNDRRIESANRFVSEQWQETSDTFAAIAKQRRDEAGFIERQIGSLEDYGLKPLDAGSITAAIDSKINAPGLRASSNTTKVLQAVKDDIVNLTEKGGGVIDAHDLYTLRKEGINERIMQILGQTDPKISAKVTRKTLEEVRPLIDDAIKKAGGTGWEDYLKTYSQGMQAIDQKAMAAEAARLFENAPNEYVKLVRGNNPDAVEAIFGPGSYDIFKEMGSKMPTLEKVASNVERNAAMKEAATAGTEALGKVIGEDSFRFRFPSLLNRATTAANVTLDILEKRLDKKVFAELQKGMQSGKSALEMLNTLPAAEKSKALRALSDPASWGKAKTIGVRAATRQEQPTNALAPANENALAQ